jgi:hypothetical protein
VVVDAIEPIEPIDEIGEIDEIGVNGNVNGMGYGGRDDERDGN